MLAQEGTPAREDQDMAFLRHAAEKHGFHALECQSCLGIGHHVDDRCCSTCDGEGTIFSEIKDESCGPRCLVAARFEALRRARS